MNHLPDQNLFTRIRNSIANPQAPFIYAPDNSTRSFQAMLDRSAQFANVLADLGVEPGDRVAVQIDKSVDALFLYLGCLRAGGVFLPLNTAYREKELAYFIEDANPTVFVCSAEHKSTLKSLTQRYGVAHLETLDDNAGSLADKADIAKTTFRDISRAGDDLAAILYTSGTTGRSKGAMLSHDNLASNALTLIDYWQFSNKDVLLHVLPIFHTHGLFVATNVVLMSGGSMIFHNQFKVEDVLAALPRASVMMGVPTFYVRLLRSDALTHTLAEDIRLFISGSAPLSPETHKAFSKRTGHTILERYGMTETNMNTSNPYIGARKPGTVGLALPDIEIRISDQKTGKRVKQGDVGVIEIRGPNVFLGYWQMPEKTAEEFRDDGFFISGDLGREDEDGYISIVGRDKDLIITGGFNVYPAEVENAIDAIDGIAETAVIGAPHADFGEGVTAIVVASGGQTLDADEIKAQLSNELAKFKIPKKFFFINELPRNKMGKIQKNQLRDEYRDIYTTHSLID